ncbi:MAG: hypothetical protein ACAI38_15070 [Myxococcota bacterium]
MRALLFAIAVAVWTTAPTAPAVAEPPPPGFQVIVHRDNPLTSADRKLIADLFLKRRTTWPDHEGVRPVDLASESPVRQRFTTAVLGKTVPQVRSYWQQRIFTGRELPPLELASDQDVVKFVTNNRGAIAYVSSDAGIGEAKALQIKGP